MDKTKTSVPLDGTTIDKIKFIQKYWSEQLFLGAKFSQPNVIKALVDKEVSQIKKKVEEENEKI